MKLKMYVGSYTLPILFGTGEVLPGKGKGIHILELDTETLRLSEALPPEPADNPSYLALHPSLNVLYAVNELKEYEGQSGGSVSAFAIRGDGSLSRLNTMPSHGADPCHLSVSRDGKHLALANYTGGSICVYELTGEGALGRHSDFVRHTGSGPHFSRQQGPHAHAVLFDPKGRYLLASDLGIDRLMAYGLDPSSGRLTPAPAPFFACRPGSGPRGGAFHPDLPVFYGISELSSSVSVLRYNEETAGMKELQVISALPDGFSGSNTCADLRVSGDGRFVYASNRGHDSLMTFSVNQETGMLNRLGAVSTGGRTPRQFAILGDILLVGNQDSDLITVFARDRGTGLPVPVSRFDTPSPVCILPAGPVQV